MKGSSIEWAGVSLRRPPLGDKSLDEVASGANEQIWAGVKEMAPTYGLYRRQHAEASPGRVPP
jgi:hypothetical protein